MLRGWEANKVNNLTNQSNTILWRPEPKANGDSTPSEGYWLSTTIKIVNNDV